MAVAALALGLLYLTPLWHIGLTAPQYPEGLGLNIWINKITGEKPQDLNSINGLNHYIGMKEIVPESFPELRYMPIAVAVFIGLGLLGALWGNRKALYAWTALFLGMLVMGTGPPMSCSIWSPPVRSRYGPLCPKPEIEP